MKTTKNPLYLKNINMTMARLFLRLKNICRTMLIEAHFQDEFFEQRVSDMAASIIEDFSLTGYSYKDMDSAVRVLEGASRFLLESNLN